MSSEESVEFDLNEFYDILTSINIKEKLKPFVRQFKKKNLYFFIHLDSSSTKLWLTSLKYSTVRKKCHS